MAQIALKHYNLDLEPRGTGLTLEIMVYRAKCTKIVSFIESIYNTNNHHLVKDAKDYYVEVCFEDEADLIEQINKAEEHKIELINQLSDLREN